VMYRAKPKSHLLVLLLLTIAQSTALPKIAARHSARKHAAALQQRGIMNQIRSIRKGKRGPVMRGANQKEDNSTPKYRHLGHRHDYDFRYINIHLSKPSLVLLGILFTASVLLWEV